MTKIYEIQGKDRCQINVHYCGVKIVAEFHRTASETSRSQLLTRDQFVQDALEHDARFGKLYRCVKSFDETAMSVEQKVEEEKGTAPARVVNTVKSLNEALVWFAKKGETPQSDEDVAKLMEKYNVVFPKWKREEGE